MRKENAELNLDDLDEDAEDVPDSESEDDADKDTARSPSPIKSKADPEPESRAGDAEVVNGAEEGQRNCWEFSTGRKLGESGAFFLVDGVCNIKD
jgi:hypothetical protein